MVIFNFRADRVVELSKALEYKDFDKFDRKRWPDVSTLITPPPAGNPNLAPLLASSPDTHAHASLRPQQGMRFFHHRGLSSLRCC